MIVRENQNLVCMELVNGYLLCTCHTVPSSMLSFLFFSHGYRSDLWIKGRKCSRSKYNHCDWLCVEGDESFLLSVRLFVWWCCRMFFLVVSIVCWRCVNRRRGLHHPSSQPCAFRFLLSCLCCVLRVRVCKRETLGARSFPIGPRPQRNHVSVNKTISVFPLFSIFFYYLLFRWNRCRFLFVLGLRFLLLQVPQTLWRSGENKLGTAGFLLQKIPYKRIHAYYYLKHNANTQDPYFLSLYAHPPFPSATPLRRAGISSRKPLALDFPISTWFFKANFAST